MRKIIAAAFLLCIAGATAAPAIDRLDVSGPFVQQASGMTYPERVVDFSRISITRYLPDGTDVSAGYSRRKPGAEIVATAYSFPLAPATAKDGSPAPADISCQFAAGRIAREVITANPALQRVSADRMTLNQNGPQQGFHASYAGSVPAFEGRKSEAVKSEVYIFCPPGGAWIMGYRFTYPVATDDAPAEIGAFLDGLVWTFKTPT